MNTQFRRDLAETAISLALTVLCIIAVVLCLVEMNDASALPEPGPRTLPTAEAVSRLKAQAQQRPETPALEVRVPLDDRLRQRFQDNMQNIADRQGWHAAIINPHSMDLTMPVGSIHRLEGLTEDPAGWINEKVQAGAPAAGTRGEETFTARIIIEDRIRRSLAWLAAFSASAIIGLTSLCFGVVGGLRLARRSFHDAPDG